MGIRIRKVLYELNISLKDVISFLISNHLIAKKIEITPNFRLNVFQYKALQTYFSSRKTNECKNDLSLNPRNSSKRSISMDVSVDDFVFGKGIVSLKFNDSSFICCNCVDPRISETLNLHKEEIKDVYDSFSIIIDGSRFAFRKNAQLWLLLKLSRKYDKAQIKIQKDKAVAKINRIIYSQFEKVPEKKYRKKRNYTNSIMHPAKLRFP